MVAQTASTSRWRWLAALAVVVSSWAVTIPVAAQLADGAIVKRDTNLRSAPAENAPALAPVKANTPVTRLPERQGAYVRVQVDNMTGWLHMFEVGSGAGAPAANAAASGGGGGNVLRGLGSFFGRPSSTTVATTTVGIRGLDANDLANAQPSLSAVTTAEGLRVTANDAEQFAAGAALRPQPVDELPAP